MNLPDAVAIIVPGPLPGTVANGPVLDIVLVGQPCVACPLVRADPQLFARLHPSGHPHLAKALAVGSADRPADFPAAPVDYRDDGRAVRAVVAVPLFLFALSR